MEAGENGRLLQMISERMGNRMKHNSKRFLAVLLAVVMLVSVLPVVSAAARSFDGSEKLYAKLDAVTWWQNDGAVTKAYFFGSEGNA